MTWHADVCILPGMALPVAFLEELRAATPMRALVVRDLPLVRAGKDDRGLCPFHTERTPSFYVYADHAHCFGCGWHGDAISYTMASGGMTFLDAVEALASEAGLRVPKDPASAAHRAQQEALAGILDTAQDLFAAWLQEPGGAAARAYLQRRQISASTAGSFGLGWSGPRGALLEALGRPVAEMIDAGLMRRREADGVAVDLFRDRLTFPIRDPTGRVLSFGGRTLAEDRQPKYINGPETPIYHKRLMIYGMDLAREALHAGKQLIVVEGYLDVVAMHQAGEAGAVAPLGTSLTIEQLESMWRLSPAPILCFDGDAAGRRATLAAMTAALPRLAADRSLSVVSLADGEDPDSLLRKTGVGHVRYLMEDSQALPAALFHALRPEGSGPGPLAMWRNRLAAAIGAVTDEWQSTKIRRELLRLYFMEERADEHA